MADGLIYPTGISSQPIDVTSGAQAFMRSAIESRLDEIESSQEQISENKKNILKAMSIRALPELANAQRDRYQKEIEDYRQGVIDKFKSSGGKLTLQQQREIQDGFMDMEGRMKKELAEYNQFTKLQENMTHPNFKYAYDPDKYAEILGSARQKLMKGEGLGDINAQLAQAQTPAPLGDYVDKLYGTTIGRMDIESKGRWINDNTFEFSSQESEDEFNRNIDDIIKQDPRFQKEVREFGYDRTREKLRDLFIKKETKVEPKRRYDETGSRWGSGRYKNVVDYTPSKFSYKGNDYSIVRIPSDVTQSERNFFVDKAKNLDTGKTVQLTQDNAQVLGVDIDKGVLLLKGKGGNAETNGELVYIQKGSQPIKSRGNWIGSTESQLGNKESQIDILKSAYEGRGTIKSVDEISLVPIEDGYKLSGIIKTRKGDVRVEKEFTTFTDPESEATFEAPLYSNKEAVANMFPKVSIRNKPLAEYFNSPPQKDENTIVFNGETYTFDELKSAGWTDDDIAKLKTGK